MKNSIKYGKRIRSDLGGYFRQRGPDQNYKTLPRDEADELMEGHTLFLVETMEFVEIASSSQCNLYFSYFV